MGAVWLPLELVTTLSINQSMIALFTVLCVDLSYERVRFNETLLAPPDADVWVTNIFGK